MSIVFKMFIIAYFIAIFVIWVTLLGVFGSNFLQKWGIAILFLSTLSLIGTGLYWVITG